MASTNTLGAPAHIKDASLSVGPGEVFALPGEIFQVADRVAVLRDGVMVGMRDIAHTTPEELVQKIVGRKTCETVKSSAEKGRTILKPVGLRVAGVGPLEFELAAIEIVGLAGRRVNGAAQL